MTHCPGSLLRFLVAAIPSLFVIGISGAAEAPFASTNIDAAFKAGLARIKKATGAVTDETAIRNNDWRPGLQLLVGVRAVENAKSTVYFIELTTVDPPKTNSAGQPWQPLLRTNHWSWSRTNKTRFITTNYPVRVRVFDANGLALKQGQTPMAWGMSTNSLFDFCRVSLEVFGSSTNGTARLSPGQSKSSHSPPDERIMRTMGGGFLWMMGMFGDLQTVPTVSDVWSKAQCAFRWPSLWSLAKVVVKGFSINIVPRAEKVTLVNAPNTGAYSPLYCLPMDVRCESRNLTEVQILVAPPHGAEMLFGGIRTVHARHPTKPKHEFITQVLSTGHVRER